MVFHPVVRTCLTCEQMKLSTQLTALLYFLYLRAYLFHRMIYHNMILHCRDVTWQYIAAQWRDMTWDDTIYILYRISIIIVHTYVFAKAPIPCTFRECNAMLHCGAYNCITSPFVTAFLSKPHVIRLLAVSCFSTLYTTPGRKASLKGEGLCVLWLDNYAYR